MLQHGFQIVKDVLIWSPDIPRCPQDSLRWAENSPRWVKMDCSTGAKYLTSVTILKVTTSCPARLVVILVILASPSTRFHIGFMLVMLKSQSQMVNTDDDAGPSNVPGNRMGCSIAQPRIGYIVENALHSWQAYAAIAAHDYLAHL